MAPSTGNPGGNGVSIVRVLPGGTTEVVERTFFALSRLDAAPLSDSHAAIAAAADPLLLVGGVAAFPRDFRNWAVRLASDGFDPYILDVPGKGFAALAADAAAILAGIDAVRLRTGAGRVHLVGHSKGGVGVLAAADARPDLVASVSTIASPHSGVGTTGMGRAARRVRRVPAWMRDLARDSEALGRSGTYDGPITNVHSTVFDGLITPRSAHLDRPGVRQVAIDFTGGAEVHAALSRTNATVFALVRRAVVDAARACDPGRSARSELDAS